MSSCAGWMTITATRWSFASTSSLGVAGLVQAVRAGTVTVANALGSGLVEVAVVQAVPADAVPPSAGRGVEDPRRRHVVVRPEGRAGLCDRASRPARHQARLRPSGIGAGVRRFADARPSAPPSRRRSWSGLEIIGQEQLGLSTVPTWIDDSLQPRPLVMRVVSGGQAGRRLHGDARRADPHVGHGGPADRVDAARRRQQGHLGAGAFPGGKQGGGAPTPRGTVGSPQHGAADDRRPRGGGQTAQRRSAVARRGPAFLAGPLCRALGKRP